MGNSVSRPEHLTFNFDVDGGSITVNAIKSSAPIQETDLEIFNLADKKQILESIYHSDYLASLLYTSNPNDYDFDWTGMSRVLYPVNAKIVNQRNELVTVESTELSNTSSESGEFIWNANRAAIMQESFKRKWFAETNFNAKVDIRYKILTLGTAEFSRKTTESLESEQTRTSIHSTQTGIRVTLEPNRSVRVDLQATCHTIDVEVEYEGSFDGKMLIGYGVNKYYGIGLKEYFLKLPYVRATATYKEIITVKYYTNDRLTMARINDA